MALSAQEALAETQKLYEKVNSRRLFVGQVEEYYRGRQRLRFASDKWAEFHAARYRDFCDNWCAPVANSPNERLRVDGFRLSDDPQQSPTEKNLWRDWQSNDMEAQSSQGFLQSIISGRSYVLVWGDDEGEPVITWERPDQVAISYDPERPSKPLAAIKTWHDGTTEFATLYTDDAVWKYQRPYTDVKIPGMRDGIPARGAGFFETTTGLVIPTPASMQGWKQRQPAGDNTWPVDNPMGVVPMVEMPNRPVLGGEPLSDIAGTMAMQDAINLLWAYLFTSADFASMPTRVVMGQEPPKIPILDETGAKVGSKPVDLKKLSQDRILWLTGQDTKIGSWEAAKLDVFTGVIETAVTHIAAQTRTPPHYLVLGKGMVNVNAEGMKTAETGLVMKTREIQLFLTPPVRGVFQRIAMVRDQKAVADEARFGVIEWKDAENHSEAQLVDALVKLQTIGFPFPWLAERYGLSQTELDRVLKMRKTEQENDPLTALVAQGGQVPPAPGTPPAKPPTTAAQGAP